MRLRAVAAAFLVSACAFSSAAPFFHARDGVLPILDGARFAWVEPSADSSTPREITFRQNGRTYDVLGLGGAQERPLRGVVIVNIPRTRERDYILQAHIGPDDDASVAYVFLWRSSGGLRMISSLAAFPDPLRPAALAGLCTAKAYGECAFASRGDLVRFYRARVYPAFVGPGARAPARYVDLRPENEPARRSMR
jgi:hypothetical protein